MTLPRFTLAHLHHTEPAPRPGLDRGVKIEGGDVDAVVPGGLEDGPTGPGLNRLAIDGEVDGNRRFLFFLALMDFTSLGPGTASTGTSSRHTPQRTQAFSSIAWGFFSSR